MNNSVVKKYVRMVTDPTELLTLVTGKQLVWINKSPNLLLNLLLG
jgi:hypothetical protein